MPCSWLQALAPQCNLAARCATESGASISRPPSMHFLRRPPHPSALSARRPTCARSAPTLALTVNGPHNASFTVTPPAVGGPWSQYTTRICLTASPTDCFEAQCTASGASACTVDVAAASCLAPATTCLRAEAAYSATATATNQDGAVSLASGPAANFTMLAHGCALVVLRYAL